MKEPQNVKIKYHVVTVSEVGTAFENFDTLAELIARYSRDLTDGDVRSIATATLGEEFNVNGCSRGYILKA